MIDRRDPWKWPLVQPVPETQQSQRPPVDRTDAQWWQLALRSRITDDRALARPAAPIDSVRALLRTLGLSEDFAVRARPDSTLAARLLLMERAEAYRDLVSRATAMYDEFLQHEIMTPD